MMTGNILRRFVRALLAAFVIVAGAPLARAQSEGASSEKAQAVQEIVEALKPKEGTRGLSSEERAFIDSIRNRTP